MSPGIISGKRDARRVRSIQRAYAEARLNDLKHEYKPFIPKAHYLCNNQSRLDAQSNRVEAVG